jgi:hypothetical protein
MQRWTLVGNNMPDQLGADISCDACRYRRSSSYASVDVTQLNFISSNNIVAGYE